MGSASVMSTVSAWVLPNSVREQLGLVDDLFLTEPDRVQKAVMKAALATVRAEWVSGD